MASDEIVTAIDIGTTKVCTIVGSKFGNRGIQVLGYSVVKNTGLRKGMVSDMEATEQAVRESVESVEEKTGYRVDSAFAGVTGAHIQFRNCYEKLQVENRHGVVTADDVAHAPRRLSDMIDDPGRTVIHASTTSYTLDGESGIRNPIGMHSKEIGVETHLVTGSDEDVERLVTAVEAAGVNVRSLVMEPLGSGLAALTHEEREGGSVIVDIGGGTTDIVAFKEGSPYYTGVIPVGGYQFTNDIALSFSSPFEAAEAIKVKYASAEFQTASIGEYVSVPVTGRENDLKVSRLEICQIVRERALELAHMIKVKLDSERIGNSEDSVLVLTGGASNLPGFAELVEKCVGIEVRQGAPNIRGSLPDELKDPAYTTGIGILLWGLTEYVHEEMDSRAQKTGPSSPVATRKQGAMSSNVESSGLLKRLKRRIGASAPAIALQRKGGIDGSQHTP